LGFLGGEGTYVDLLTCFEQTGILLRRKLTNILLVLESIQLKDINYLACHE